MGMIIRRIGVPLRPSLFVLEETLGFPKHVSISRNRCQSVSQSVMPLTQLFHGPAPIDVRNLSYHPQMWGI